MLVDQGRLLDLPPISTQVVVHELDRAIEGVPQVEGSAPGDLHLLFLLGCAPCQQILDKLVIVALQKGEQALHEPPPDHARVAGHVAQRQRVHESHTRCIRVNHASEEGGIIQRVRQHCAIWGADRNLLVLVASGTDKHVARDLCAVFQEHRVTAELLNFRAFMGHLVDVPQPCQVEDTPVEVAQRPVRVGVHEKTHHVKEAEEKA
mmetsp:Transcript_130502/g.418427  ORF Transcript_130502/g.418427 Transcript_130502/m.418427 type:complete len:206 (-) Transcript_130502:797-1414(-)